MKHRLSRGSSPVMRSRFSRCEPAPERIHLASLAVRQSRFLPAILKEGHFLGLNEADCVGGAASKLSLM